MIQHTVQQSFIATNCVSDHSGKMKYNFMFTRSHFVILLCSMGGHAINMIPFSYGIIQVPQLTAPCCPVISPAVLTIYYLIISQTFKFQLPPKTFRFVFWYWLYFQPYIFSYLKSMDPSITIDKMHVHAPLCLIAATGTAWTFGIFEVTLKPTDTLYSRTLSYTHTVLEHDKHLFQYRKGLAVGMGQPCPQVVKNCG